jgi:diaminopimelate decarboxylase
MLFGTMEVNENELFIGGMSISELKEKHGTPLFVYDEALMDQNIESFKNSFVSNVFKPTVVYASKAFLTKGMASYIDDKGLYIDAVSAGELYTIYQSGFEMSHVVLHGNNKSIQELEMALDYGVGYIVVDHEFELELLNELAQSRNQQVKTLLRVNPGVEAHTHEYIQTSLLTSKFGTSIFDLEKINYILGIYEQSNLVQLSGYHCHIGSQVFDMEAFIKAVEAMVDFSESVCPQGVEVLNLGGGFGVQYMEGEAPVSLDLRMSEYANAIDEVLNSKNYQVDEVMIEPGRSIVGTAGTTLYTVGAEKETFGGKNYAFIDGGMTDNIRPALYQAEYTAVVANKMNLTSDKPYTVAGKCCESGDIVVRECLLPQVTKDDIIAVLTTGAYGYSMASNYNRMQRPEVVFVKDGESRVIVRRETLEDLISNDE